MNVETSEVPRSAVCKLARKAGGVIQSKSKGPQIRRAAGVSLILSLRAWTFLAVQWLRLCTSTAGECTFDPWSGCTMWPQKGKKKVSVQLLKWKNQIEPYSAFLFHSGPQWIGGCLLAVVRTNFFISLLIQMASLFQKHLTYRPRNSVSWATGHLSPVKLLHKINHHSGDQLPANYTEDFL